MTIQGFFPGADFDYGHLEKKEPSWRMTFPMVVMTVLAVVLGMFPGILLGPVTALAELVL